MDRREGIALDPDAPERDEPLARQARQDVGADALLGQDRHRNAARPSLAHGGERLALLSREPWIDAGVEPGSGRLDEAGRLEPLGTAGQHVHALDQPGAFEPAKSPLDLVAHDGRGEPRAARRVVRPQSTRHDLARQPRLRARHRLQQRRVARIG
jgi:hypothetical protein